MGTVNTMSVTFIDVSLADIDVLIAGLEPGTVYYVLNRDQDGLAQMASILGNPGQIGNV